MAACKDLIISEFPQIDDDLYQYVEGMALYYKCILMILKVVGFTENASSYFYFFLSLQWVTCHSLPFFSTKNVYIY